MALMTRVPVTLRPCSQWLGSQLDSAEDVARVAHGRKFQVSPRLLLFVASSVD
jgi:hypothetical protein